MRNSKYKNIIFDLGGVLVNWKPEEIIADIFKKTKIKPLKNWNDFAKSDAWLNLDKGIITRQEAIEELNILYDYDLNDLTVFCKHVHKYLFPLSKGRKIFDLIKSRGYKTYILSNFQDQTFQESKHQYDFLNKVDGAVYSYQVKSIKPEPQIYQTLLTKYNLKPQECIFIDDIPENIIGALNCGMEGIVCKNHAFVLQELKRLGVV